MTKDKTTPATELSDDDLDAVQGGLAYEKIEWTVADKRRTGKEGIVLSSESHEPAFKRGADGIVLSSETHEPNDK